MKRESIIAIGLMMILSLGSIRAVEYELVDLGKLSDTTLIPLSINDSGQVAGTSGDIKRSAFCWENGQRTSLPIPYYLGYNASSVAYDMNNNGEIVGFVDSKPIRWKWDQLPLMMTPGWVATVLNTLGANSTGMATAVNNSGRVIGNVSPNSIMFPGLPSIGAYWDSTTPVTIDTSSLSSDGVQLADINDGGQMTGVSLNLTSGISEAFLRQADGSIQPMGALSGDIQSFANAINESGRVVGYSADEDDNRHAFLWSDDTLNALSAGGHACQAYGINNDDAIVGSYWLTAQQEYGCLWKNESFVDLNSLLSPEFSEWTIQCAFDINQSGWIVAGGINPSGEFGHGILLKPIPEPATMSMILAGTILVRTCHLRRRRKADSAVV